MWRASNDWSFADCSAVGVPEPVSLRMRSSSEAISWYVVQDLSWRPMYSGYSIQTRAWSSFGGTITRTDQVGYSSESSPASRWKRQDSASSSPRSKRRVWTVSTSPPSPVESIAFRESWISIGCPLSEVPTSATSWGTVPST